MKLVFVAPFGLAPKNTTARRVMPMARAMAARGHDVRVVVPAYDDPESCGRRWTEAGVEVHTLPRPRVMGLPVVGVPLTQLALAKSAMRRVRQWRPDVVHVFKPKAVSGFVQAMLWRTRDRPGLVLDCDDWEGKAGWSANEPYSWWQRELFERQERWGLAACDARTAASTVLAQRRGAEPVACIVNGYDAATYHAWPEVAPRASAPSRPHAVIYTRFYDLPPEAWVRLVLSTLTRVPELTLSIVGAGPRSPMERVLRTLEVQGMSDRLHVHGWLDFARLGTFFAGCDIALMPMADTLANRAKCSVRFMDLMTAGVPIVASPIGEATTYVRDGETGYLASDDSAEALAAAAVRALEDPRRNSMAAQARAYAMQDLSWTRLTAPLAGLYEAALGARANLRG